MKIKVTHVYEDIHEAEVDIIDVECSTLHEAVAKTADISPVDLTEWLKTSKWRGGRWSIQYDGSYLWSSDVTWTKYEMFRR